MGKPNRSRGHRVDPMRNAQRIDNISNDIEAFKQDMVNQFFGALVDVQRATQGINAMVHTMMDVLEEHQVIERKLLEERSRTKAKNFSISDIVHRRQADIGSDTVKLAQVVAEAMVQYDMPVSDLSRRDVGFDNLFTKDVIEKLYATLPEAIDKQKELVEKQKAEAQAKAQATQQTPPVPEPQEPSEASAEDTQ